MEIERKFIPASMPEDLEKYEVKKIEQGYLCTDPVVRVRRSDDEYWLTYKSKGMLSREEYNLPLSGVAYAHLKEKIDGRLIVKKRYLIPYSERLTVELDVFEGDLAPLVLAEIEFESEEEAKAFEAPAWLGKDVTYDKRYSNSSMSRTCPGHIPDQGDVSETC